MVDQNVHSDMPGSMAEGAGSGEINDLLRLLNLQTGGEELDSYLAEFHAEGKSHCSTVWTKGAIAYRCRTCQVNDSSGWGLECGSICVACFVSGNHQEHDYVMYFSESGSSCDCGDPSVWKVSGMCSAHRNLDHEEPFKLPSHIDMRNAVGWVLRELSHVLTYIGEFEKELPITKENMKASAIHLLKWLQKVCSVDAVRNIVCLDVMEKTVKERVISEMRAPLQILLKTFSSMPEEIMNEETTLYLQMLHNLKFKQHFSGRIGEQYQSVINNVVENAEHGKCLVKDFTTFDSSLETVMMQLVKNPDTEHSEEKKLLELFVEIFGGVLKCCVTRGTNIVNVRDFRIWNKVYLRPQQYLHLIVAHASIAQHILEDQINVFNSLLNAVALLQWMNSYSLQSPVDLEEDIAWTRAIELEMNTMAIVVELVRQCYLLSTLDSEESSETSILTLLSAAKCTLTRLQRYLAQESTLDLLSLKSVNIPVSFHIPLHRTLSTILAKLVLLPWKDEKEGFLSRLEFDYSENEVLALMEHPLRITVWMAQIRANQLCGTSDDFSRLELMYRGSFWHSQSMDMDILLLQFCTVARINMEHAIIKRMAERFELEELLSSPLVYHENPPRVKFPLLQDFMRLILLVVREHHNAGMKEDDCLRYDIIQWLSVKDQTYSQLCRALSANPLDHRKIGEVLEKVAHFHEPKVQKQAHYQMKAECWEEFDPLFSHFYLNELEVAQERAIHVGKLQHYWRIRSTEFVEPPYDRLINLLHTEGCHLLLWNVLNYLSSVEKNESRETAGEALGVIALQIMALALQDRGKKADRFPLSAETWQQPMLPCDDIFQNVYRRPSFNKDSKVMEWGFDASEHPSILDLLGNLQASKSSPRLVDSINYVFHLLAASPLNSASGPKPMDSEPRVSTNEHSRTCTAKIVTVKDEQRSFKKQRQEQIMEQFKAKQKAFRAQVDVNDTEEDDTPDISEGVAEGSYVASCSTNNAGTKAVSSKEREVHECAICRSECCGKDKPTGWIALVQRYNMPNISMNKATAVSSIRDVNTIAKETNIHEAEKISNKCADGTQLVVYLGREKTIDHIPTEHVRCCGHKMHQACFQSYYSSLLGSHCSHTTYEGKNIIDLNRMEFLCPVCRRLSNALLPVVHEESLSRMLQDPENDDTTVRREKWTKFWDSHKNLPSEIDAFLTQSVRVRSNFRRVPEPGDFRKCSVLWEMLAGNIVHCEVETREEIKLLSSSTTSTKFNGTWGRDSQHWKAIRELGKLAMLSNTIETAPEMETKREKIDKLIKISHILSNGDFSNQSQHPISNFEVLARLQKLIEKMYKSPQVKGDISNGEEPDHQRTKRLKRSPLNMNGRNYLPGFIDLRGETRREDCLWPSTEAPPMPQYSMARGMPDYEEAIISNETESKKIGKVELNVEDLDHRLPSYTECCHQPDVCESKMEWCSSILTGNIHEAEPFWLLILLLSAYPGWPKEEEILLLVKFSYNVAVTQTLLASSDLHIDDDKGVMNLERDWDAVIQHACLPFLRRAALLMQAIDQKEFEGGHDVPGREAMDTTYLQQKLGLTNCQSLSTENQGGGDAISTTRPFSMLQQLQLYHKLTDVKPILKIVSKQLHLAALPSIFQELMLRTIQERCIKCKLVPGEPAVCLVCGVCFCCGTTCCMDNEMGECSSHAEADYAGIGIFLLMRSTQLLLIRGDRVWMGPSLYLDQHGEEDTYLRRSQLLYLSDLRLNEVRRLWLTAGFDYNTQILHNSRISSRVL